jgi:homoserine kinase
MKVTAFAPATTANVAVGFDILGFALEGVGDEVTVELTDQKNKVEIVAIEGIETILPSDPKKNTAGAALLSMQEELDLDCGFRVQIQKGIAMGSGMGGSSASAVAAVIAAQELLIRKNLIKPLNEERLLHFALQGEQVASQSVHGDNVGPCLLGGLVLVLPDQPMRLVKIPTPDDLYSVVVHPDLQVETRTARALLKKEVLLSDAVLQNSRLAGFLAGCYQSDLELMKRSMNDVLIEPQRSHLIRGFQELKAQALAQGAIGFSISGSGPSVFAWAKGLAEAKRLCQTLIELFKTKGLNAQGYVSKLNASGARVLTP